LGVGCGVSGLGCGVEWGVCLWTLVHFSTTRAGSVPLDSGSISSTILAMTGVGSPRFNAAMPDDTWWLGLGLRLKARGSEEGSHLRPIDFVYHSTLGLRVIQKKWVARG